MRGAIDSPFVGIIARWAAALYVTAVMLAATLTGVGYYSAALFDAIAAAGVGLLIAYSVMAGWGVHGAGLGRSEKEGDQKWLGIVVAMAVTGLIGIAVALAMAEYARANGGEGFLVRLGFWTSVLPVVTVGLFVALQPAAMRDWLKATDSD